LVRWKAHSQGYTATLAVGCGRGKLAWSPALWRTLSGPREAPREKLSLSRGCPRRYWSQWNAQGQLSAPILSLRSSAAYRPAGATFRNRQTACPKDDNGSDTCVGYPRTLRPRSSAREAGDSVVLCVSGGTVSQSTKSTETTKSSYARAVEVRYVPV